MADQSLVLVGVLLIIAGSILAFLTMVVHGFRGEARSEGGAVIIIGLFPIVLGSNKQMARSLLVLTVLLVAILTVFFILQSFLLPS